MRPEPRLIDHARRGISRRAPRARSAVARSHMQCAPYELLLSGRCKTCLAKLIVNTFGFVSQTDRFIILELRIIGKWAT